VPSVLAIEPDFERAALLSEIDLDDLAISLPAATSTPKEVGDWLRKLANEIQRGRDAATLRRRIKDGLTRLAGARDVEIRREPVPPPQDCESFCFTLADSADRRSILQVTFDRDHAPSETDFKILQAGASLATMLAQFEEIESVA
jgi:hypothetical protein